MEQRYIFSGHESFPCKSLWLKKGYDFVVQEKNFSNPDAVIDLGVGKNMVASIHYWLRVFKICKGNQPTWLGRYLFDETNGKDKYIENLATLWLLHFSLVLKTMPIRLTWSLTGGPTSGRRLMSCLKKTKGVQKNWKNKSTFFFLVTPMWKFVPFWRY